MGLTPDPAGSGPWQGGFAPCTPRLLDTIKTCAQRIFHAAELHFTLRSNISRARRRISLQLLCGWQFFYDIVLLLAVLLEMLLTI